MGSDTKNRKGFGAFLPSVRRVTLTQPEVSSSELSAHKEMRRTHAQGVNYFCTNVKLSCICGTYHIQCAITCVYVSRTGELK